MRCAGLIGIGRMGTLMLRCLRRRGIEVAIFDTRSEATAAFSGDSGVRVAAHAREVAELAEVVGIVVFDDAQALDVLEGPGGVLEASGEPPVILVHSTLTAGALRKAASAAEARGFTLLDAAVSGGTREQQESGDLCVMVGGDARSLERARPMLDAYAGLVEHMGGLGSGLDAKLIRNLASFSMVAASYEAFDLARSLGLDTQAVRRILEHTRVMSENTCQIVDARPPGRAIDSRRDAELAAQVRYLAEVSRKDLEAAIERAAEAHSTLPIGAATVETLARAYRVDDSD